MWRFFFLAGLTCLFLDHVFTVDDVKKSGKRELVYLQLLGKLQQYEMGKFLRKFYHHFITSDPGEVDAFSSFEDRSTIGLVTLMASLYAPTEEWEFLPGFKWQPTVLCYMEKKDIFFSYKDRCTTLLKEKRKILSSRPFRDHMRKDKHDWNLAAVLSAMRLSNGFRPPPCATISFEMYKQDEEYTVRALFFNLTNPEMGADQDPHPLLLEGCTEYCPLASFVRFFAPVIPEYKKLCGKKIKDPEDVDMEAETTLIHMYADLKAWTTPLPM
ncbi:unnamed protein product [Larinioides sclopetarius]|uniref:Uncharacterized protein n=1 Tax=Larinioides sclopetarius TaxID=280406 RepID=A0AAV2B6S5_9ARAC